MNEVWSTFVYLQFHFCQSLAAEFGRGVYYRLWKAVQNILCDDWIGLSRNG